MKLTAILILLSLNLHAQNRPAFSENYPVALDGNSVKFTSSLAHKNSILLCELDGRKAIQFMLSKADHQTEYSHRAELGYPFWQGQKEQTVSFGMYAPRSFERDSLLVSFLDFHDMPDTALGETWRAAPITMYIQNDSIFIKIMWSPRRVNSLKGGITDCEEVLKYNLGPLNKERWVEWKIHVVFGYRKKQGSLEIYKDNELIFTRANQPNSYNDKVPPSVKVGMYIWDWDSDIEFKTRHRVLYISNLVVQ